MSNKGSQFERDICKRLSLWWSSGNAFASPRDDLFWRTAMSGGRATVRGRQGRETHGQYGDISATHPQGEELLKLVTIELKRGYSKDTFLDIIEKDNKGSVWWHFLKQARRGSQQAGTPFWWLIVKRDYCEPMLYMPMRMARNLGLLASCMPTVTFTLATKRGQLAVTGVRLNTFLANTTPVMVKTMT